MTELLQATELPVAALPLAEGFIRDSQPLREDTHDLERKVGSLADQKQELLFRYRHQFDVGDCGDRGAAWLAVDQCHLAENAFRAEFANRAVADLDPDLSAFDHVKLAGLVAFSENGAAGLEGSCLDIVAGQYAKTRILLHGAALFHRAVTLEAGAELGKNGRKRSPQVATLSNFAGG
jgi:hypothetical protein